jgi:hypothetical protein
MTFRSTTFQPYDPTGFSPYDRPADPEEMPEDVYRHLVPAELAEDFVFDFEDDDPIQDHAPAGYDEHDFAEDK